MNRLPQRNGYSIVMADDDIDDQALVRQAFRKMKINHVFTSVFNGVQLIEFLLKKGSYSNALESPPDFIILDVHMNLLDGFETISAIQSYPELTGIPVYILTTSTFETDRIRAQELKVRGYFIKPENPEDLPAIAYKMFSDLAALQQKNTNRT